MYHINSPQTSRQPLRYHPFNFYIDAEVSSTPLQSIRAARRLVSGSCKVAINHLNESCSRPQIILSGWENVDQDTLGDEQGEGSAMVVDESHKLQCSWQGYWRSLSFGWVECLSTQLCANCCGWPHLLPQAADQALIPMMCARHGATAST